MSEAPSDGADERPAVLSVGTLTKVHGIRGELKLHCAPDMLAFLRDAAEEALPLTLRIPHSGDEYEVTFASVRGHESAPIVAIDGVDSRSAAEEYRGALICAARELLPEPEEDEFFLADLEGCVAHAVATGERIGQVAKAEALPANVVLTIALDAGGTLLAPLVDIAIPHIDAAARRLEVDTEYLGLGDPIEERDA